jgi:hypothetical protein
VAIVRQTVVETAAFLAAAKGCLSDEERFAVIDLIAADPERGVLIQGGGGLRNLRFGIGGRGKRGGARVVYYFHGGHVPIFLLTVFAKNERDNLSKAELNSLATATKMLARTYGVRR